MHYAAQISTLKRQTRLWLTRLFESFKTLPFNKTALLACSICLVATLSVVGLLVRKLSLFTLPQQRITLALPTPFVSVPIAFITNNDAWTTAKVKPGETLSKIFHDYGLSPQTMERILSVQGLQRNLRHLQVGDEISFDIPSPGKLRALRFDADSTHTVFLTLDNDAYKQQIIERDSVTHIATRSAVIKTSLWDAARAAGLSPSDVAVITDEMFKYDIDFDRDLRPGDHFNAVVRETWREGERLPVARVEAATFIVGKKTFSAFRYQQNGKIEYFDGDGHPLKKPFIRMPIPFARLTSTFGMRLHPVLGKMRVHKGVDYAAAIGTPIMAAGDALVQFVGTQHGYGNFVILDHGRGYSTLYAHMSRFGKIKPNQRISQGTTIGYVGMTGLATGPHLHYEFRVNGEHRNPLTVTMPPAEPLHGAALVAFREAIAPTVAELAQREHLLYASVSKRRPASALFSHG